MSESLPPKALLVATSSDIENVLDAVRLLQEEVRQLKALLASQPQPAAVLETMTVREVAAVAHVEAKTVREWIRKGRLPALRGDGSRRHVVRRSDLENFLCSERSGPAPADEALRILAHLSKQAQA